MAPQVAAGRGPSQGIVRLSGGEIAGRSLYYRTPPPGGRMTRTCLTGLALIGLLACGGSKATPPARHGAMSSVVPHLIFSVPRSSANPVVGRADSGTR